MKRELPKMESLDMIYAKDVLARYDLINRVIKLKDQGDSFQSAFKKVMTSIGTLESKKSEEILFRMTQAAWEKYEKPVKNSSFTENQQAKMKRGAELLQYNEEKRAGQSYHESGLDNN